MGRVTSTDRASDGWTSEGSQNEGRMRIFILIVSLLLSGRLNEWQQQNTNKQTNKQFSPCLFPFPINHFITATMYKCFTLLPISPLLLIYHRIASHPSHSFPFHPINPYSTHKDKKEGKEGKEGKEDERTK